MDVGDLLLRWTIRLALGLYVLVLAAWLWTRARSASKGKGIPCLRCGLVFMMRLAWTLGCLLAVVHTACAFQFVHGWSHAAALEATAEQTRQRLGIAYGGGLYWNYVFLLVWSLDVAWWWTFPRSYLHRSRWLSVIVHGFLGFMAFNGAIVFADGAIRWVGLAACLGLLLIWLWRRPAFPVQGAPAQPKGLSQGSGPATDA